MCKLHDIIFHFNKKHLEDPRIPMWVIKSKGETHYVHHVDVDAGVGFSTKETPNNSTKGSIKIRGVLHLSTDNGNIIAYITKN